MRKTSPLTGIASAAASASAWLRRRHPARLLLVLPVLLIGACGSPEANATREQAGTAQSVPDARMIASLREMAGWANRTLTRAEIDTYTRTPSVLESLRLERRELALARLCWAETRAMDRAAQGQPIPEERYRSSVRGLGLDPDSIDCPPEGPLPQQRAPARASSDPHSFSEPAESFGAVLASSQTVFATMMPAQCEGLVQLPDPQTAIPSLRRRWHGEVRIAAPRDAVLREEFRRALGHPRLREALGGLSIRLVERDPNVAVRGLNEAERCYDTNPQTGECGPPFVGRCGGTRFRKYDRLAADLTAGRRSYLRDASDFVGTDAGSPVAGFTLSDREGRIDGAVCLLPDEATGGPAAHGPEFSREAKAAFAIDCIAHALGLGGPPSSIRPRGRRAQRMFVTVDDRGTVQWSRTALALLASSYS